MKRFRIESTAGIIFGIYEGENGADAHAAMLEDAGCCGGDDGAGGTPGDWIIREITDEEEYPVED